MLLFPLATALVFARLAPASLALGAALLAAFLAHEPLLILLGRRGPRALRVLGPSARPRLLGLTVLALGWGLWGLWLAPAARPWALPSLGLALVVGVFMARGQEKTVAGELSVSAAFASACVPIGAAGAEAPAQLLLMALIWFTTFSLQALAVKATLAHLKGGRPLLSVLAFVLPLVLLGLGIAPLMTAVPHLALALVPASLASLLLGMARVHPRKLRVVGWALVATDVAVFATMLLV